MTISQLIEELQQIQAEHGDLPVYLQIEYNWQQKAEEIKFEPEQLEQPKDSQYHMPARAVVG